MPNSATGGYLTPLTTGPKGIPAPAGDLTFEDQIGDLVSGLTGINREQYVRPRWQPEPPNIPPIETDWVAVGILSVATQPRHGSPIIQHYDDPSLAGADNDGHDVLTEHEEISLMASFYGPNGLWYAGMFRDGVWIGQNWEEARSRGIALLGVGTIRLVPEQINNRWYRRADIDFQLRRQVDRSYDILNLKSAQGTFVGMGGTQINSDWNTENV